MSSLFLNKGFHRSQINSLEDYSTSIIPWNVERMKFTKKLFSSISSALCMHNVQLGITAHTLTMNAQGDVPTGAIAIAMSINNDKIFQQNSILDNSNFTVIESGGEVDAHFPGPVKIISIFFKEKFLKNRYEKKFDEPYPINSKAVVRVCDQKVLCAIKHELVKIITSIDTDNTILDHTALYSFEDVVVDNITDLLYISKPENKNNKKFNVAHGLYKQISLRYNNDINIAILCKELGISERNAYLTFKNHYNLTPNNFLRYLRLHKVKKELLESHYTTTTISSIAIKNGFYHISYFASVYKSHFGELPSITLRKSFIDQ
ncbi:helix-turn-helix transcriptional regulator [Sulfurimonas sp.]|nr:helix-turn-helix transcriptional regulator [Sulfurimonas sp.]